MIDTVTYQQLEDDTALLFTQDGGTDPGTVLLELLDRPTETVVCCRHRGHERWHLVTLSFRELGHFGRREAYLTVWEHRTGDDVQLDDRKALRWRRVWGPSDASMIIGDPIPEPIFPPIDPDPEEE